MTTIFKILFTVSISHAYYASGCRDFDFVLNAGSEQLLRNFRLIAKVRDGKLFILYEANSTGTTLLMAGGKTLRIGLKLLNPYFSNITDLPLAMKKNPVIYLYRNTAGTSTLDIPKEIGKTKRVLTIGVPSEGYCILTGASPVMVKAGAM